MENVYLYGRRAGRPFTEASAYAAHTKKGRLRMQYQFEEPFIVDSRKMVDELGASFTPVEQALAETVDTYRPRGSLVSPPR